MGKMIIITVLSAIVLTSILNLSVNNNINSALENSVDYYAKTAVRNIANSTVNIMNMKLNDDNSFRVNDPLEMGLFNGTATYAVTDVIIGTDSLVQISVSANYFGVEKNVVAFISVKDTELPPFLEYAILGDDEVLLDGNFMSVEDYNDPNINTSIHSNQKLTFNGNNLTTEGFATSSTLIDISGSATFTPNSNPENLPTSSISSDVVVPVTNVDDYIGIADETYFTDKTYSGNITLGTKANPKIIYVQGILTISGVITGYGTFLCKEDINIVNDLAINSPDPNEGNLFLMSNGNVTMSINNTSVWANIFSQNDTVVNGEIKVYGSIISKHKATLNGEGLKLYYKPPSTDVIKDFFAVSTTSTGRSKVLDWFE